MQTLLISEQNSHIVKDQFAPFKPDIVIGCTWIIDQLIAHHLEVPHMKFTKIHFDALASGLGNFPSQYTYSMPCSVNSTKLLKTLP